MVWGLRVSALCVSSSCWCGYLHLGALCVLCLEWFVRFIWISGWCDLWVWMWLVVCRLWGGLRFASWCGVVFGWVVCGVFRVVLSLVWVSG